MGVYAALCAADSPEKCQVSVVPTAGYSAGKLIRVHHGKPVSKSTDANSCPKGFKIWSPRTKKDWTIVYYAMGKSIDNYPKNNTLIVDITRASDGCYGCGNQTMASTNTNQSSWTTSDSTEWWLRDTPQDTKLSADYKAGCYLQITGVDPDNVQFDPADCSKKTTEYLCQAIQKRKSRLCVLVVCLLVGIAY